MAPTFAVSALALLTCSSSGSQWRAERGSRPRAPLRWQALRGPSQKSVRAWERREGRREWAEPGRGFATGSPAEQRPAETQGAGDEERGGKEGCGR